MEKQGLRRRSVFPGWEVGPAAVGLGLVAHLVSGGVSPGVPVLVALTALLSMCASLIARVKVPNWLLLVLCGVSQQVLHLAFDRLSGTFSGVPPAQHQHAAAYLPGQLTAAPSVAPAHSPDLMLDTHVAAALLTALLVAKVDTSVTRALTLLRHATSGGPPAAHPGGP